MEIGQPGARRGYGNGRADGGPGLALEQPEDVFPAKLGTHTRTG